MDKANVPSFRCHQPASALDTRLSAHLYRLRLSPDPYYPWCRNVDCGGNNRTLHAAVSHRILLRSQLLALNITTFDLPTLLGAVGVHPSRQSAVIRLTCVFLRKTGQLPRL